MNDPQLMNILISIIGALLVAALGWLAAAHRAYRKDLASLRAEIRTEFAAVNARSDARADELSRRIDNNGRRIDDNGRRIDDNGRRIDAIGRQINQIISWMATLAERLIRVEARFTRLEVRVDPQAPAPLEELPLMQPPPAEQEQTLL